MNRMKAESMALPGYIDEFYKNPNERQRKIFSEFLERLGLEYEDSVELTLKVIEEGSNRIVGTGSIEGKIIKCMAIDPKRRGEGLSAHILSTLVKEQFIRGRNHIFVFTNPKNIEETSGNVFAGFKIVSKTDEIVLLEMGSKTIKDYLSELEYKTRFIEEEISKEKPIGAIVVNCNPFTLGHQYLIETASKECSYLIVFVVSEDKSAFPTEIRKQLVIEGTKHLDNVIVLEGGDYIISPATFPRYFMKECDNISLAQARLDVTIFGEYIAPTIGITRRYVGEEPYCMVTKSYNQAMKEILIPKGIELKIIPRKELYGEAISASQVRELIRQDRIEDIQELVPETTYDFVISKEAIPIIKKIRKGKKRH